MGSQQVIVKLVNKVRIIRLNRPKTKNAFNSVVYRTITSTLKTDANNDDVVATVITGNGDYYSSGFDIKASMTDYSEPSEGMNVLKEMFDTLMAYPKLVVALVNGPAIGIAATTAALCDVVYASDKATFHTPFVKIGLCAEGCSSYTFPRIMGRSKASEMLLMGKKMTASEALQFGFISKVIPHTEFETFANQLINELGDLPLHSVRVTKSLIMKNLLGKLQEVNNRELSALDECFKSEAFGESVTKFLTKSKL